MASKPNLVIVESPAKAKTIEKYLGADYTVKASMGHMRDLPKSKLGVDIEHGFLPQYEPLKGKETAIGALSSAAKSAKRVYLATDPDREGEAIAWHLKEMLGLNGEKAQRVTFNEITKKIVNESIAKPRELDMDLVNAQQARRVLDRIVGYQLSPLLWTKIKRGLSAGRVQSVATRIVCDREEEIRAFVPEEYWNLDVLLRCENGAEFLAKFYGNGAKQQELHSKEETDAVIAAITGDSFKVKSVVRGTRKKSPPPPFITSTLQMEASRKLNFPSRKTMSVAQSLYEAGHITYMRTDSLRLSDEALAAARSFIVANFGADYHNSRVFKAKAGAQDAHEAIRPSYPDATPESLRGSLSGDEYKLYKLVWSRFTATQMSDALYDTLAIDSISAGYVFRATESNLRFEGFLKVYQQDDEENKKRLPDLSDGDPLNLSKFDPQQKWTQPPPRYTEDSLIRVMEELGIGRPSTYAPTISTIMAREYVAKNGKALEPTALGETVNSLMKDLFASVVDTHFTAEMETSLDAIADGKRDWQEVLSTFYTDFAPLLDAAKGAERYKIPVEETDEICEVCGRNMVIKSGRFGRFLACPGFPECTNTKPLVVIMPGECPKCGGKILKREAKSKAKGKAYNFYACEKGKDACGFITFDVPTADNCPECGKTMFKKDGKGAHKAFCANATCPAYVAPKVAAPKEDAVDGAAPADVKKVATKKKAATTKKPAATKKTTAKKSTTKR